MKDKPWIKGVEINVNLKDLINMGDYSSIEPTYGEKLIVDVSALPEDMSLEDVRNEHIKSVQAKFNDVRHQKLNDFLVYNNGVTPHKLITRS
jgi:hypothetical protein